MRLSQLARKLSKTPSEIIQFFEKRGLKQYNNPNSKISPEHIELLYKKYRSDLLIDHDDRKKSDKNDLSDEISHSIEKSEQDKQIPEDQTPTINEKREEKLTVRTVKNDQETVEVIRAPKIKLEGVKVIGKIELPEKINLPQKEESTEKRIAKKVLFSSYSQPVSQAKVKLNRSQNQERYNSKNKSHNRDELTYEEKLKREEKKRKKQLEKERKLQKERKKEHYFRHVQPKTQAEKKVPKRKNSDSKPNPDKPVYKSPLRKFWAWLNNEYDKYE